MIDDTIRALNGSWQMLAGTTVSFAAVPGGAADFSNADLFYVSIDVDGRAYAAVLQSTRPQLLELASVMFDQPAPSLSIELCADAGKELCNILSSCCIKHLPLLHNGEIGLPLAISAGEAGRHMKAGLIHACFSAGEGQQALSISIVSVEGPCVS